MDFIEKLKEYASSSGFKEINEIEITKPEFREKRKLNPTKDLILRKEVKDHFFYILVDKEPKHDHIFYLRVYNRHSDSAARCEYEITIEEFLEYNEVYLIEKDPRADVIGNIFDKMYNDVLNKYLKHKYTNNEGVFIKEYDVTGRGYTTQIRLNDGRIYYAPSCEFIETSSIQLNEKL